MSFPCTICFIVLKLLHFKESIMYLVCEYWAKSIFILTQWFVHSNIQKQSTQSIPQLLYYNKERQKVTKKWNGSVTAGFISLRYTFLIRHFTLLWQTQIPVKDTLSLYTLRSQEKFPMLYIIPHFYLRHSGKFFSNTRCRKWKSRKARSPKTIQKLFYELILDVLTLNSSMDVDWIFLCLLFFSHFN